jgi:RNA polymerase sigma factor (sigma-70 family)
MKLRKTPTSKRMTYTYFYANGDRVIFEPGKSTTILASGSRVVQIDESITDTTIMELHRYDDAEVRSNLKYINIEDNQERQERIANKKKWAIEHPYEPNPYDKPERIISLDAFSDDEDAQEDKSRLLYQASLHINDGDADFYNEKLEMIREYVATLPETMQELFDLIYIKELKQSEVCEKLGLSKSTVSERVKTLQKKIIEHFSEQPELLG